MTSTVHIFTLVFVLIILFKSLNTFLGDTIMRNNIELNKEEYNALLEQFYTYFEDGYKFEEFLKIYLEKIGLEEVYVTKRSGDGHRHSSSTPRRTLRAAAQEPRRIYF